MPRLKPANRRTSCSRFLRCPANLLNMPPLSPPTKDHGFCKVWHTPPLVGVRDNPRHYLGGNPHFNLDSTADNLTEAVVIRVGTTTQNSTIPAPRGRDNLSPRPNIHYSSGK